MAQSFHGLDVLHRMSVTLAMSACAANAAALYDRASSNDWSGFRGPRQSGQLTASDTGPSPCFGAPKIVWKRALGTGYSSISIADGHAVTMFGDATHDYVISLHPDTGEQNWRYRIGKTFKAPMQSTDGPLSTPTIDDGMVFALGPRGRLVALALESGQKSWSKDLVTEHGVRIPEFGIASSPLVVGGTLVVQANTDARHVVLGFDKQTGLYCWGAGQDTVTYQTPVIANLCGHVQVVAIGDTYIHGIRPVDGMLLWRHPHGMSQGDINPICPVVLPNDGVFLSNYYSRDSVLFRLRRMGQSFALEEVWRSKALTRSYTIPVTDGRHIYGYTSRFLTCVDAATGRAEWKSRPPGDGFVIKVGHALLFVTKNGSVRLARPTGSGLEDSHALPVFEDVTWTAPSFAEGRAYLRNFREIAAVEFTTEASSSASGVAEDSAHGTTWSRDRDDAYCAGPLTPRLVNPSGAFADFVRTLRAAPSDARQSLVDTFMSSHTKFPVIEDEIYLHIVYRGDVEDIELEGDMLETGDEVTLAHLAETDLHYISFELEPDAFVTYRFNLNYDMQTINDPLNEDTVPTARGEESFVAMPRWIRPMHFDEPERDVVRGSARRFKFKSQAMGDTRSIDVYLPEQYAGSDVRFPVVYVAGGRDAQEIGKWPITLDRMIHSGDIRPVIVVFLDSDNAYEEYAGKHRDRHATMWVQELIPEIDRRFRTIACASARACVGADVAAYAAIYAAFKYPDSFSMVAGQSTHLFGARGGSELIALVEASNRIGARFYLEWGKYGLRGRGVQRRPGLFDWARDNCRFAALLRSKGYEVVAAETHGGWGWASWRSRTNHILRHFFGR